MSNTISSKEQLLNIQEQLKGNSITEWSFRKPEICNVTTISQIGELWQSRIIDGSLCGRSLINETLEFLMLPLLINKVNFYKYQKIVNNYTESLNEMDIDGIYEESIQALIKIGYVI